MDDKLGPAAVWIDTVDLHAEDVEGGHNFDVEGLALICRCLKVCFNRRLLLGDLVTH